MQGVKEGGKMMLDLNPLALPGVDVSTRPVVAAGPCSAETEAQVMETATALAEAGVKIFRPGYGSHAPSPDALKGWVIRGSPGCAGLRMSWG